MRFVAVCHVTVPLHDKPALITVAFRRSQWQDRQKDGYCGHDGFGIFAINVPIALTSFSIRSSVERCSSRISTIALEWSASHWV